MTDPVKGGRYIRDPETGALTPENKTEVPAAVPEIETTTEAPKAKTAAQRKKEA